MSDNLESIARISGMRSSGGRWRQHCVTPASAKAVRLANAGAAELVIWVAI